MNCYHYDKSKKPMIEVVRILKSGRKESVVNCNEIVFFIEGRLRYIFNDFPAYEAVKGEMVFLPAGGSFSYEAKSNTMMIIFRFFHPIKLCEAFSIENLYIPEETPGDFQSRTRHSFSVLEINSRLWHFLDGVNDCLSDGFKCQGFLDIKVRELLYLLRAYYTRKELHDFFFLILSEDTAFSEYVRLRWQRFRSIAEMAESMNLSHKQFSKRFTTVFGKSPQRWLMEARAQNIHTEITSTNKPFKQIAAENGLGSDTHFTWFCKKAFNQTPSSIRNNAHEGEKSKAEGEKSKEKGKDL